MLLSRSSAPVARRAGSLARPPVACCRCVSSAPPLPLKGKLVVSMEQAVAAPYCTSRMADAGARVIKIERPEGDFARAYDKFANGLSSYFVWLNRGKESVVANIKDADDRALLYKILAKADVFVQNLAPGAAARSGLGSAELRKRFPQLICVDISGYGEANAYSDMKAYDLLVQAEAGLSSVTGQAGGAVGGRVGVSVCDIGCGMYCYSAVLEALMSRELSGEGCVVDASLFSGVSEWMTVPLLHYESDGMGPKRVGLAHPTIHPYGVFETADGPPLLISIQNEREFAQLCKIVLLDESIPEDPRFCSNVQRVKHEAEFDEVMNAVFGSTPRAELCARLDEAKVAYGAVNDCGGLSKHPALRRVSVDTEVGPVSIVAPAARFNKVERTLGPVPAIGAHTDAIKAEFGS